MYSLSLCGASCIVCLSLVCVGCHLPSRLRSSCTSALGYMASKFSAADSRRSNWSLWCCVKDARRRFWCLMNGGQRQQS